MVTFTTVKPFFNEYDHSGTRNLLDELTAEVIQIAGMDMYYLPRRRSGNFDEILYEDTQAYFDTAYQLPILIKSSEGFMGSEAMMTHFGIESRVQMILTVSRAQWEMNIRPLEALYSPREGDLIHLTAFDNRTFEIKFVDDHPYFYQHGHLPMWDLTVELFEYAGEIFNTSIESIDCMAKKSSINAYDWAILTEDGKILLTESGDILVKEQFGEGQEEFGIIDSNDEIEDANHPLDDNTEIINWDENNPYSENEPWG